MILLLAAQTAAAQPLAPPIFDYPPGAVRSRAQGEVAYELAVTPDGRVSGCRITRSSGAAMLDEATCHQATQRLRFNPARDAAGTPMAGTYAGAHRYALDGVQTVTVAFAVNTEGRVENCEIAQSSGTPQLDEAACKTLTERGRFSPKQDAKGRPVRVERREQRITFATSE